MTIKQLPVHRKLTDPEQLSEVLGVPFSQQQLDAITAPPAPAVIIAGAGSGKTTVMAARVVWLVGTGTIRPEQILGLTFTRKAAAELSARVRTALVKANVLDADGVDEAGEQVVMTYDAFAARLVTEHGLRIGVDGEQTMISGATRYRLASRVIKGAAGPFEALSRLRPASLADRVLKLDADLQAHLVSRHELDAHARQWRLSWAEAPLWRGKPYAAVNSAAAAIAERLELASLVGDYQALKNHLGVVEFADQMAIAARLVREVPEVAELVRDQFRVVLLDEYQDTSAAQAALLQGLFSGPDAGHGRGHPVTAVGDPHQAIYGWRGAAASNILQFTREFPSRDGFPAASYPLTVNRRSGHRILAVANQIASSLRSDPMLARETTDTELVAPPEAPAGEVRAATFDTWGEEVTWIGDQVVAVRSTGAVAQWSEIAVLTRRNGDIGPLYNELVARDVPVEIVGLGGLLGLPEIRDVVATLRILDDVTANPDLIRLLTGPRWSIGPRDLALLGHRARDLAQQRDLSEGAGEDALLAALEHAVAAIDPTEVISVLDAVTDPGDLAYSPQARERFREFAQELADLRSHAGEPVLDLTRRVITTLGLDVELLATAHYAQTSRRNQLAVFVDAVADYVDVDGDASLGGLLAYLRAEEEHGNGLDRATPSDTNSVKLLTVHKAKGLEWTVVFLPALVTGVFPSDRVTDNWIRRADAIPADLRGDRDSIPQLQEATNNGIKEYAAALKEQQGHAEDRLGYVAVTRAKRILIGSAHMWRPENAKPRTISPYLEAILAEAERQDRVRHWAAPPALGTPNPLVTSTHPVPWPRPLDPGLLARRQDAALAVSAARARYRETGSYELSAEPALLDEAEIIAGWDTDVDRLVTEARETRRGRRVISLPESIAATGLLSAAADPAAYAERLIRPMPLPPAPAARFGTRFHRWIERHYATRGATIPLVDTEDLPERGEDVAADERALKKLCDRFAAGRFGERVPYRLELPFVLMLADTAVRGRIDAVYRSDHPDFDWLIIDWKTGRTDSADPGQLAIYRRAWAELAGVSEDRVDVGFYFVTTDELIRPTDLPDPAALLRRTLA